MAKRRKKHTAWNPEETREQEHLLVKAVRSRGASFLDMAGVTSVGVGRKNEDSDELCIQFTVENKQPASALEAVGQESLPKTISFVDEDGNEHELPTDVLERSYATHLTDVSRPEVDAPDARRTRRSRQDTVQPGLSISHSKGTAGTLGAIVFDRDTGEPFALSNWHVLHSHRGKLGDSVTQPGPADSSRVATNRMGRLVRSFLGLAGDCAIASIDNRAVNAEILGLDDVTPVGTAKAQLGDKLIKSGRTTGITHGVVSRVSVRSRINYGGDVGVVEIGGFEIRPNPDHREVNDEISMGGDSGSLWMSDEDGSRDIAVGLHFAGEASRLRGIRHEHALACQIHSVFDKLNVSFERPRRDTRPTPGRRPGRTPQPRNQQELIQLILALLRGRSRGFESLGDTDSTCTCPGEVPAGEEASAEGLFDLFGNIGLPVYGNWCGPGHGGGTPVDAVDAACQTHDNCYGDRGYFDCQCDDQLVQQLNQALNSGTVGPYGRFMGRIVRNWFDNVQPCTNH